MRQLRKMLLFQNYVSSAAVSFSLWLVSAFKIIFKPVESHTKKNMALEIANV